MSAANDNPPLSPVTVITGGSQGIGRALAYEFASGGYDLLLVSRNRESLEKTAADIRARHDVEVKILACDLVDPENCARVEQFLHEQNCYCQNLVNNAGFGLAGDFARHRPEALLNMIDLNIRALTDLSRRFLPDMQARRQGGILFVASMGGLLPGPYQATYYASKAYVISLGKALSWECFGSGVRISTLAPGPVRTGFHRTMGARSELYVQSGAGISARKAAHMGYTGFLCGKSLIIPGILSQFGALALKILPHDLLMPFMSWFLKSRLKNPRS